MLLVLPGLEDIVGVHRDVVLHEGLAEKDTEPKAQACKPNTHTRGITRTMGQIVN